MTQTIKCSVVVRGRVQGVGFRAATRRVARKHGVRGWVRNSNDGSVEALLYGTHSQIDAMLDFLRRGPRFARVDSCEDEVCSFESEDIVPDDFTIPNRI